MKPLLFGLLLAFTTATQCFSSPIAGPITNTANSHVYFLLAENAWTTSESEAVSMGGHLVAINDQDELNWVTNTFGQYDGLPRALWIGLTDQGHEGDFVWVSGEPVTYTNWYVNEDEEIGPVEIEPNDYDGFEEYVHIFASDDSLGRGGFWNDAPNLLSWTHAFGVVEVNPVSTPGSPVATSIQSAVAVRWASQTGKTYQVQWTSNLASPFWVNLGGPVPGTDSTCTFFDVVQPTEARFYRVLDVP